jgi:hypothetical protein
MNPRFLPDEPPGGATVKITLELSREELGALDRACAENKLTREQFARRPKAGRFAPHAYRKF